MHRGGEVLELGVSVRVIAALLHLGRRLQAEIQHFQQPTTVFPHTEKP